MSAGRWPGIGFARSAPVKVTPVIEATDCTNSGNNNSLSSPWVISLPAQSAGDLILFHIVWDGTADGTGTPTSLTLPSGPGGETPVSVVAAHTGGNPSQAISVWYWIAASAQSAGTYTVTPDVPESWTATVVRVPAGEFDATTPIGASATGGSSVNTSTTASTSALTAGATDGGGRLCAWLGVDADPITAFATGVTAHANIDIGAVSGAFWTRDAAVTDNESIPAYDATIEGDTNATFAYVLRAP